MINKIKTNNLIFRNLLDCIKTNLFEDIIQDNIKFINKFEIDFQDLILEVNRYIYFEILFQKKINRIKNLGNKKKIVNRENEEE